MKYIGILVNKDKDTEFKITSLLIDCIVRRGGKAILSEKDAAPVQWECSLMNEDEMFEHSEIVICLGGDGTFLNAARKTYKRSIPMLGVNLGTLGFLTEVDKNEVDAAVESLLSEKYVVEKRMMLELSIKRNDNIIAKDVALNDIVISRNALSRILHVKTYINDVFVDMFPCDGMIVASPTGSTAYSLSAGGPIVEPNMDLIIVTPVCPHILYSRSFLTSANSCVKVTTDERYSHTAMVTVDGQKGIEIRGGDIVEVRKSPYSVDLIRINPKNFFNVLRNKIYYRGESLKQDEA